MRRVAAYKRVVALPGAPTFGDPSVSAIEVNIATTVGTAEGKDFACMIIIL